MPMFVLYDLNRFGELVHVKSSPGVQAPTAKDAIEIFKSTGTPRPVVGLHPQDERVRLREMDDGSGYWGIMS